jgi:pimeloyl-ACP methyl ester carboxylesterase
MESSSKPVAPDEPPKIDAMPELLETQSAHMQLIRTERLEIAFEEGGAEHSEIALLLHGWPDDPRTWHGVSPLINSGGRRTIAPWLRGFGPTRFLSEQTCRDGRVEALAQDAIDLMDALDVERFAVIGHDWGARVAYALAALIPERVTSIATLSLPYSPRGASPVPSFSQSRAWWYQWFMSLDRGAESVRKDPKGFARIQWDTWSPPGWFDDAEFAATARSFENPDWPSITLSGYRSRWRDDEPRDESYDELHRRISNVEKLAIPALMIQGGADGTVLPSSSEGKEEFFTGGYYRLVLDDVGHFPTREAPERVVFALLGHLHKNGR